MAIQPVAFFYYHLFRESIARGNVLTNSAGVEPATAYPLHDSRQGETVRYTGDLAAGNKTVQCPYDNSNPLETALDTVIISGHNFPLHEVLVDANTPAFDLLTPNHTVTEAIRDPIVIALDTPIPTSIQDSIKVGIIDTAAGDSSIFPEWSEVWVTQRHTMTDPPVSGWDHSWRWSQTRFVNQSGVTSTWLTGAARKTYRLTWENVTGADLVILENMRDQSDDFTQPFWMLPPDDAFPILLVEMDRDSDWEQVFLAPLTAGLAHRITLPLIEVTA